MSKLVDSNPQETLDPNGPNGDGTYGFYIAKNFFAQKIYPVFPDKGYRPAGLVGTNDDAADTDMWLEFNRDVKHYQKYYSYNSWWYKIWTFFPAAWFLVFVVPPEARYYDLGFMATSGIFVLTLALAVALDAFLQRRLLNQKIHPMYALLVETYKPQFSQAGYWIDLMFEPTQFEGTNSYIQFSKLPPGGTPEKPNPSLHAGFYLDEDFLGALPYAVGEASNVLPPKFLVGIDTDTWKNFCNEIKEQSKTPRNYLVYRTLAMALPVGLFTFFVVYIMMAFHNLRIWLPIIVFPLYWLCDLMRSFRRRHYAENVLEKTMENLLHQYEPTFSLVGYTPVFELEYVCNYMCVNTVVSFHKSNGKPHGPLDIPAGSAEDAATPVKPVAETPETMASF